MDTFDAINHRINLRAENRITEDQRNLLLKYLTPYDNVYDQQKFQHFEEVSGKYTLEQIQKLLP